MKKTVSLALVTAFLFLVMGCTLSMDEWVETEEDKGYDEVETVENDYMKLDYEYKKTTRSLTEDIQKYIVQIDDSVLYFLDNTPSDYLPKAGGQVVANCCEMFPMGLMARVLSVDKANGLFKVVTTEADIEDCFEEFNLDIDTDVFTGNEEEQERDTVETARTTRSGGGVGREVTIRDWSMFKAAKDGVGRRTRTSLEDEYKEDVNETSDNDTEISFLEIGANDEAGKVIRNLTHNVVNTIEFKLSSVTNSHIHKIVNLKDKREYTKTRIKKGLHLSLLVGHDFQKPKNDDDKHAISDKITEMIKQKDVYQKFSEKVGTSNLDDLELTVEFPILSLPFGFILRLKPIMDLSMGIYGSADIRIWESMYQTTTDVVNGTKKVDKSEKLKLYDPISGDISAFGSLSASGGAELFLGVGKKVSVLKSKPFAIGLFANGTLDFSLNISPLSFGDYSVSGADDFISLTGKAEIGGKLLTAGLFGDVKFSTFKFTWWDGWTKNYNPRLKVDDDFPLIKKTDTFGHDYCIQRFAYTFTDLGMHKNPWWARYRRPILAVYKNANDPKDKPIEILWSSGSPLSLATKTAYEFNYTNFDNINVYVIPGTQCVGEEEYELYPQYGTLLRPIIKPTIEYDLTPDVDTKAYSYIWQIGYEEKEAFIQGVPVPEYWYRIALPFTLRNAAYINEYWDDWGVIFYLNTPKRKYNYPISFKNKVTKSGKYVARVWFSTEFSPYEQKPLTAEGYVYYKRKGHDVNSEINSYDQREFSYQTYKLNEKDEGEIWLKRYEQMLDGAIPLEDAAPGFKVIY